MPITSQNWVCPILYRRTKSGMGSTFGHGREVSSRDFRVNKMVDVGPNLETSRFFCSIST